MEISEKVKLHLMSETVVGPHCPSSIGLLFNLLPIAMSNITTVQN
jgi:hypothetical protein